MNINMYIHYIRIKLISIYNIKTLQTQMCHFISNILLYTINIYCVYIDTKYFTFILSVFFLN